MKFNLLTPHSFLILVTFDFWSVCIKTYMLLNLFVADKNELGFWIMEGNFDFLFILKVIGLLSLELIMINLNFESWNG